MPPYHLCDHTPWHELLSAHAVLDECAGALGIKLSELLGRIIHELSPPNWQAFFWMRAYIESVPAEYHLAVVAQAAAMARDEARRHLKDAASKGGVKRADKYGPARTYVRAEWAKHGHTEYNGNKSDFARTYSTLVLQEFGHSIVEKTIRETWLKDMS